MRQDVVILGTGAFALEAMEAAHRAHARSITLITRPRDRCVAHCIPVPSHDAAGRSYAGTCIFQPCFTLL
jgi:uncharacterized NAD(P)/FAD-binding protein YdhS